MPRRRPTRKEARKSNDVEGYLSRIARDGDMTLGTYANETYAIRFKTVPRRSRGKKGKNIAKQEIEREIKQQLGEIGYEVRANGNVSERFN